MIGFLSGTIRGIYGGSDAKAYDVTVLVDVSGVGYEVTIPVTGVDGLASGSSIELFIHTDVRENAIQLFGFRELLDKQVFLLLKRVKGIGSKTAMSVVGLGGAVEVLRAIANEDTSKLKSIPGVGGRTAERIIVELRELVRGMLPELNAESLSANSRRKSSIHERIEVVPENSIERDVALALERLGFPTDRAANLVRSVVEADSTALDSGELLRRCLATL
jgi:Holliday junction DNA helicase RuvA